MKKFSGLTILGVLGLSLVLSAFAQVAPSTDPSQMKQLQVMNENADAFKKIADIFMQPYNLFLLGFLVVLGAAFKKTPNKVFPDWAILFSLIAIGGVGGWLLLTETYKIFPIAMAVMLGIVDGVFAGSAHQILKQLFESPLGVVLLKLPGVQVIAALLGIETTTQTTVVVPEPPTNPAK